MKHKSLLGLAIALAVVLILGGSILMVRRAQAQEAGPQSPIGAQGVVTPQGDPGTAFTYQGRLVKSGVAVSGTCDFQFSLWSAVFFGSQVGTTQTYLNGQVTDGYFAVSSVDFGDGMFTGDERWLKVGVRCPAGSGSYTDLFPLTALRPAPYALSLRPGAVVSQTSTAPILSVVNNGTGYGVYGTSRSSNPLYAGVVGSNPGGGAGAGVYGYSGGGYGVYGRSTANKAIYSDGDAHVEGNLTWKARTSYISIPAAAFHPIQDGYDFQNLGFFVWNGDSFSDLYAASVQLPHGATVTRLTFYWWDGSVANGHCYLRRTGLTGSFVDMATADTSGSAATADSSQAPSIANATIDNSQYAYYLYWDLPDNLVEGYGVVIEYTFTGPY